MARKKAEVVEETPVGDDYASRVVAEIRKTYGEKIALSGDDFVENPPMVIPVGPAIDVGLHGGIPEGSWVTSSGQPKCGKTTSALSFAANCQKPEYGGRHIYYLSIEGRIKRMNLQGIDGLDVSEKALTIIQSEEERILSANDFLTIAAQILHAHPGCVIIIDSVSALCDEKEMTGGIGAETRGSGNKLFTGFCRQMANVVPLKKSIVWCVLHLQQSQGMYGPNWTEKAAQALKYQADVQIRCQFDRAWNIGTKEKPIQIGQEVHWLVESCALGSPGMKLTSYLRYGVGIDRIYELMKAAIDFGVIDVKGTWHTLSFMERHLPEGVKWSDETVKENGFKAQGEEKLYIRIKKDPAVVAALEKEVKELIG
jgi:RecA/RadA recombinase